MLVGVQSCRELEVPLGLDGWWEGMWSRYERGLVEPSRKRIERIEMKVPGSARYFCAGFWALLENRAYGWKDIDAAVQTLPPMLFDGLRNIGSFGRLCSRSRIPSLLDAAVATVVNDSNGIYGLTAILVLIREAELAQDEGQYIRSLQAWAKASEAKAKHRILCGLPSTLFAAVAIPLLNVSFSDPEMNASWEEYFESYVDRWYYGEKPRLKDFDGLDCISRFTEFVPLRI